MNQNLVMNCNNVGMFPTGMIKDFSMSLICLTIIAATLCILMDFPKHINSTSMRLSIVYFKGSRVIMYFCD